MFYDRYEKAALSAGMKPVSNAVAQVLGITRASITQWKSKNLTPKGETVKAIADLFHVSTDFLLERTDDPTDYTNPDLIAEISTATLDEMDGDVKKAVEFQKAVEDDVQAEKMQASLIWRQYMLLDQLDRAKLDAYLAGLLSADKYAEFK